MATKPQILEQLLVQQPLGRQDWVQTTRVVVVSSSSQTNHLDQHLDLDSLAAVQVNNLLQGTLNHSALGDLAVCIKLLLLVSPVAISLLAKLVEWCAYKPEGPGLNHSLMPNNLVTHNYRVLFLSVYNVMYYF